MQYDYAKETQVAPDRSTLVPSQPNVGFALSVRSAIPLPTGLAGTGDPVAGEVFPLIEP